jgi:hypothetical protein
MPKIPDVRWRQRFHSFGKAFAQLSAASDLAKQRKLSDLEQQGLIQAFEFTHELAWNILKDFWNRAERLTSMDRRTLRARRSPKG